jgi:hypothetical protein
MVAMERWETLGGPLSPLLRPMEPKQFPACPCPAAGSIHKPDSLNPGWPSGRLPSGQKNLRSESLIGRSLMLA